jgi:hypothetical protein
MVFQTIRKWIYSIIYYIIMAQKVVSLEVIRSKNIDPSVLQRLHVTKLSAQLIFEEGSCRLFNELISLVKMKQITLLFNKL